MGNAAAVKIGCIGFGNMASAMVDGWIASGVVPAGHIGACANRYEALCERTASRGCMAYRNAEELVKASDVVVVAVKPYMIEDLLAPLAPSLVGKVVISVAAGWNHARYEELVPGALHVSTVPNTPVSINEGVIACEETDALDGPARLLVDELLGLLGSVVRVPSHLLSVAGTVGGCSPAFIAMVIEALADAAVKHGISRADAYTMVSQMVAGTAKLQLATGMHPGAMKDAVCSPGGTTIRGVAALEEAGMRSAFIRAIDAIEG
ncbi:MAG: pyrroline-5-carboxylate reductase [Coriobacteriaceae bacterium]|nr:pyrroline-5-carboxylate reductase [Coriobacteriaceae bacterium]